MSATEAAKQKLEDLRKQLSSYREKLQQQEAELRRLQNDVYQNRTVVEVTMPGEIRKAYGQYLETLKTSPSQTHQAHQKQSALFLEGQEEQQQQDHHTSSSLFSPFSFSPSAASPGSLLSLLTFTTTLLLALYDTLLVSLADKILAQILLVMGFFFPAVAYANHHHHRFRRSGAGAGGAAAGGCTGGGYYGRRRGSTRFAPIHM